MRTIVAFLALLAGSASQAAPVTIDFESAALGTFSEIVVDGFRFSEFPSYANPSVVADTGGNQRIGVGAVYCGPYGQCDLLSVVMTREDGGAFSYFGADLSESCGTEFFTGTCYSGVAGTVFGGGSAAGPVGTGDWLNLQSVSFGIGADTFSPDGIFPYGLSIDNVVVQAVPVPAAAWLFASALFGLGWVRRKPASRI